MHRQASFIPNFFPAGTQVGVDAGYFSFPPIDELYGRPVLITGNLVSLAKDTPAGREVVKFMMTPASVEAEVRAGDLVAPMNGVPPDWYPSDSQRGYAGILGNADSVRFDGSDMMPSGVGAGRFWTGMIDYVSGESLDTVLQAIDATWPAERIRSTIPSVCADPLGCIVIAAGEPIHIAWALTVSGPTATLGQDSLGAIEIAIDDNGGELLGHPIELTGEDTLCTREGGQVAGTRIAADPTIVGIIGTSCSSEARAAMPRLFAAGMVMISPSNTNPDLTNPDHPDHWLGYLRTAQNDLFQGRVAAEFAYGELGLRRAATIHDGSPYARSLQEVFAVVFRELGGIVTAQEAVNVGDTDMTPVLTSIAAGTPQIIYFPVFEPEGNRIAQQARQVAGLGSTVLMGADGLFADTFPEATGDAAAGMYLSAPAVDPADARYAAFLDKWQAKFGGPPPSGYHAHAYDATNILFNAIEKVADVASDGTAQIGRQALRDAMYATSAFPGLTGTLSCDANGDCATGEALAVFIITAQEVAGRWPPQLLWRPGQ
jgi:branched-chain amino acid transport system substrate-binding protein